MHHLATFWEVREQPNVVLVHYADLQRDLEGEMRRIAQRLDIDIDENRLPDLVAAARFDTMRDTSRRASCPRPPMASCRAIERSSTAAAMANGKNCSIKAGRRRYAERVNQLAPTDLTEWAHHEPLDNLSTTPPNPWHP